VIEAKTDLLTEEFQSGQKTAKKAAAILVSKNIGFIVPTARQKLNLLVAFAKKGKVIYGRAFDIVKLSGPVILDDLSDVEKNLNRITIFEIKSTRKVLKPDFSAFFFSLSGAEVLVAQSLKKQFKFALVNTTTSEYLEMDLAEIFARAKGIYSGWSIML
jgi:diacylglycerol kinase